MNLDNKITNGYGEFIVYSSNKELPPLDENEYFRIYSIFSKYSPGGLLSNQGKINLVQHYENRFTLISQEVHEIKPDLKVAFIPKTLYELVLLRKLIKEDIKNNKCCPARKLNNYYQNKIRKVTNRIQKLERDVQKTAQEYSHITDLEKRNRYIHDDIEKINSYINEEKKEIERYQEKEVQLQKKKCWHHMPIRNKGDLEENDEIKVKKISYLLNRSFAKLCSSEEAPFSYTTILKLVEKEFQFFQNYVQQGKEEKRQNLPLPPFIKGTDSATHLFRYDGERAYGKSLAIWKESDKDFIRQAIQMECSKVATNSVLLSRASPRDSDSKAMSLSFGTSLFAGIMNDNTATVWYLVRNQKTTFYMIPVPIDQIESSCFYVPRANTICQLFSQGETFHARTKVPEGQNNIHGVQAGPGSTELDHLYIKMNLSEITAQFEKFKKSALLEIKQQ